MKIFELFGSIFIESDKANESLDKTDGKAKGIVSSLGSGIKTAAKWSTAIVGGATLVAGAALKAGTKFAETTDNIDKMSQKLGLSRQGFQEWDFIMSQSGASLDSMKAGMTKLNNTIGDLQNGSDKATEAFDKIGLSLDDVAGKSQEEIFEMTIKGLQGVQDEGERARLANELLGKSGVELAPLLNAGTQAIDDMKKQAGDLGLVMGDEAINAGVLFADTMDQAKRAVGAIGIELMTAVMPVLQLFMEFIIENMPLIREVMSNVFTVLQGAIESVIPLMMNLIEEVLPPLIELFSMLMADVLPILIDVFTLIITTILPPLIEIFMAIIETVLPPIIELFNALAEEVLPPLAEFIQFLFEEVLPPLLEIFKNLAEVVLPLVVSVFETLIPIIGPIMDGLQAAISIVLSLIKGDWEGVWNGIKDFFQSTLDLIVVALDIFKTTFTDIFQAISDVVSGIWDGLVNIIKGGINWIIEGINVFLRGINAIKIPDWVPGVGGKGFNIPEIPMLAQGGEIIESGRVLVGEEGPEFLDLPKGARVVPLDRADEETGKGDINQTINVYSPKPLSPSETAKQVKRASRELALEFA